MDCNKEEAVRAKGIAEKKMENKDFVGARKIVLKAQQLYPDLENISQMIVVCDVHISADNKIYGNEKDWYAILKVEPTADEASIRKQYRKFALLLHPDKNKFPGADDAFKLIGEAQSRLLDREKRQLFDNKIRAAGRFTASSWTTQPGNKYSHVGRQPWVQNNFMRSNSQSTELNQQNKQPQQQVQSGLFNNRPTFWTVCPFCCVRYQFYKDVLNKLLWCQSCRKSFVGYETNVQGKTPGTNSNQHAFPQQKEVRNQGPVKAGSQSTSTKPSAKVGFQGNGGIEISMKDSSPTTGCTSKVDGVSKSKEKIENVDIKINNDGLFPETRVHERRTDKKRKQVSESSESCDTGSSTDSEDIVIEDGDHVAARNFGCYGKQFPRRSSRSKPHVSYNENLSDDDGTMKPDENLVTKPLKRAKCDRSFRATEQEVEDPLLKEETCHMNKPAGQAAEAKEDKKDIKQKEGFFYEENLQNGEKETVKVNEEVTETKHNGKSSDATCPLSSPIPDTVLQPETCEYPDPDFSDFDKDRKEECFAVGQIWAVYDTLDAMPRYYVRIRKVSSTGFKLRITWLEPDPDDEDDIKWFEENLPVSCGIYRHGSTENMEEHPMFSHMVCWEKGGKRDTYMIYPREGETWAIFKNWDIKWYSDPDSKRKYEFEFVEILSDYAEGIGVHVAYLSKVRGFACLFCRIMMDGMDSILIPPREILRFSHRVPSFQMTGEEREDVPKGSFELDPLSLPTDLGEIDLPVNLNVEAVKKQFDASCYKSPTNIEEPMAKSEENTSLNGADRKTHLDHSCSSGNVTENHSTAPVSAPDTYEIPEPEFYNFDADKTQEKLQVGQIWALYSDEDGLPKYYGRIMKIDSSPEYKLHLTWLIGCLPSKDTIQWVDKKMPICCGRFKPRKGRSQEYTDSNSFSHQLSAEHTDKEGVYAIFPGKGEVWALYKDWSAELKCSDLRNCRYDMVEVIEEADAWITVLVLESVDGFTSVFKAQKKGRSSVTMKIPRTELLRFSHQIPAFRLTSEKGGSLEGFWELDPAALPIAFFRRS